MRECIQSVLPVIGECIESVLGIYTVQSIGGVFTVITKCMGNLQLQGGEDPEGALSRRSFSVKEPLRIGLFCGK